MRFPVQATVNTGAMNHPIWRNGQTVWVLGEQGGVCKIASARNSEPEGTLRKDKLEFDREDD